MFFHLFLKSRFLIFRARLLSQLFVSLLVCSFVACSPQVFAANPKILIFGDSLSAAYGLSQHEGWAALLQKKLNEQRYQYDVVNASVSGETTSGGLSRLNTALAETQAAVIILELGANDGLRGLPLSAMNANLSAMIKQSKKNNAKVLLLGMKIPPNYGPRYANSFSLTYSQLSKDHKIKLVPFMLENVAAKPDLIQQDGLHPNAQGQPIILENVWPHLQTLLKK
jgi:acyl-CoA thioesterase I